MPTPCTCVRCGKSFSRKPSQVRKYGGRFCSRECAVNENIEPLEQRFWRRVIKKEGCWGWSGFCNFFGYGQISLPSGNATNAHRVSWELHYGTIPEGMWVLHRCDNPPCVNPEHLFLGTHEDNMRDMAQKNRSPKGESSPVSKLTDDIVREMRSLRAQGWSQQRIADKFGVSQPLVGMVCRRKIWSHVS